MKPVNSYRERSYSCPDPLELQKIYCYKNIELRNDDYIDKLKDLISKITREYLLNKMSQKVNEND